MNVSTTYNASPDDLRAIMVDVVAPLVERIRYLETGPRKHAYTTAEAAAQIGYSKATVLQFIRDGRKARNGRTVQLPAHEITPGDYRIRPEDLDSFIAHF